MERGQIVETGGTEAIFGHAKHPYTQKLLSAELPVGEAAAPADDIRKTAMAREF
jgi:ABC-type oligopeptide transport system ATPase subunit